jgi:uncharacterized membrane protein
MLKLYFGNAISIMTTVFVLALLFFVIYAFIRRGEIDKWGRYILVFILVGTAISGLSATRDAYMTANALFTPNGLQSLICAIAGGLIFLTGIVSLFVRKQAFRKIAFQLISIFFIIQVVTVEVSRAAFI